MVRIYFFRLLIFIVVMFVCSSSGSVALQNTPLTDSAAQILVEAKRGQILYQEQPNLKLHISVASKIMTAILALQNTTLDTKVTVSKNIASQEGAVLQLEVGEQYTVEQLIYSIILSSANDSAYALAEFIGGDIKKFVDLMNNKAAELNMKNTNFTNPSGLYDARQYTTAYDLTLLLRYALNNPNFESMFSTKARPWNGSTKTHVLVNSNKLLWSYEGADGGKSGFNDKNKQTVITTAARDDLKVIAIVLDAAEDKVYKNAAALLDYGFDNFKVGLLLEKNQPLKSIQMEKKDVTLISTEDVYYTYPLGENHIKNIEFIIDKKLKLPLKKDKAVGIVRYLLKDNTTIEVNLFPTSDIYSAKGYVTKLLDAVREYRDIYILLVLLFGVEIFLIISKVFSMSKRVVKIVKQGTSEKSNQMSH